MAFTTPGERTVSLITTAFFVSNWAIRIVMLIVVPRRHSPNSALAWLLVVFIVPWFGLFLYLLMGGNRLPKRRIERHSRLLDELKAVSDRFRHHPNIVRPQLDAGQMQAVTLAERLGNLPILGGNNAEIVTDSAAFIDRLVEDIDRAERHVHLLYYIYFDDETGRRVADAMARAVKRGVFCRVLVDAVGSRGMLKSMSGRLRRDGVDIHPMLPVNILRFYMARIDIRNHRKLAVIDGATAYTGSHNIVNPGYGRRDLVWHDMTVRLTGPAVLELQAVFFSDWYFETGETIDTADIFHDPDVTGNVAVQPLPSGPNYPMENYELLVLELMYAARENVSITTPYFVPDEGFLQALRVAVMRGVEVDLYVPLTSDQRLVSAASKAYFSELLEMGVNLHLFRDGLLHSKTMTIDDDITLIGTSNFDIRSFALNFEINLAFYDRTVTRDLRGHLERYRSRSHTLPSEEWNGRPTVRKIYENIAKLMSPLL